MSWYLDLPGFSHRRALERKDQVVRQQPRQYKDTNEVDPFTQLTSGEDPSVEEQNRYLDCRYGAAIVS